jgi:hypothetical protein
MKKIYTSILIALTSIQLHAQSYYPMLDSISNTWYFVNNVMPVKVAAPTGITCNYLSFPFTAITLSTLNDTLINGNVYKILQRAEYNMPGNECEFGYLREDTALQKIFFVDNIFSPEEVLYDFSLQAGSTIAINGFLFPAYYENGVYTVDSIGTITIPAGQRRIFYLRNHNVPFSPVLEWIESVGHPGHLVYTRSMNAYGGVFLGACSGPVIRDFYQLLTCFEHNSSKVYFDSCAHAYAYNNWCFDYADSCNYWNICGNIKEHGAITAFIVSPNPAKSSINIRIQSDKSMEADFIVSDITGKQLLISSAKLYGSKSFTVDVSKLSDGIYFLECRTKEGSLYRKLAVD